MRLFVITHYPGWGSSTYVIRAASEYAALSCVPGLKSGSRSEVVVVELEDTKEGILWCHDESPDTPRDGS